MTAFVPSLGYTRACELLRKAQDSSRRIRDLVVNGRDSAGEREKVASTIRRS